jgi:hypothetical protein
LGRIGGSSLFRGRLALSGFICFNL